VMRGIWGWVLRISVHHWPPSCQQRSPLEGKR
jgi:hypothetical protein